MLAGIIEELRCIFFWCEMCLGTIGDGQTCVGRESWLARARMFELDEQIVNVPGHAESAAPARKFHLMEMPASLLPAMLNCTPWNFLRSSRRFEMLNANVFDTKVIHNEAELKWTPFVAPETWRGSSFVEALGNKVGLK